MNKDKQREEYEAKRERRVNNLRRAAKKKAEEAQMRFDLSDSMASIIPMGQPILVGHHSENADRRYRERIHNHMRKGIDAQRQAQEYERRADAAEKNRAIFTEDPDAAEKLTDKIERLEAKQKLMREANKLIRKQDTEGLKALGFTDATITQLYEPDFCGRVGFPDYALSNNSANIRRLKQRLQKVERRETMETTEEKHGETRIVVDVELNRVQIYFPEKPDAAMRSKLKRAAFKWAPSRECWQRHAGQYALDLARQIVEEYNQQ